LKKWQGYKKKILKFENFLKRFTKIRKVAKLGKLPNKEISLSTSFLNKIMKNKKLYFLKKWEGYKKKILKFENFLKRFTKIMKIMKVAKLGKLPN